MGFQCLKFKLFVNGCPSHMMCFFDWKNGLGEGLVQTLKIFLNLKFTFFHTLKHFILQLLTILF